MRCRQRLLLKEEYVRDLFARIEVYKRKRARAETALNKLSEHNPFPLSMVLLPPQASFYLYLVPLSPLF
jgi:hypothetical protein